MKVAVLTSSRADYSIYLSLLKKLKDDPYFDLSIIAFGTHLSPFHGYTINQIKTDKLPISHQVESIVIGDDPETITSSIGLTATKFASIWAKEHFDIVFALGDRFEMFAAVLASVPFNLKIAHIHGGETTLGAIDNIFRHSISLMSKIHFVSTETYKSKLISLLGTESHIYNVGALSIENLMNLQLLSINEFKIKYDIDLSKKTVLCTFHPETVSFEKNDVYINELLSAISKLVEYQIVFTMPNIDTMGSHIRKKIIDFKATRDHIIVVESFGTIGYLTAMKYCSFILGNSSSGFVEASFFPKKVINIGRRQKGRIQTKNIYNCEITEKEITSTIYKAIHDPEPQKSTPYGDGTTSDKIISYLKQNELSKSLNTFF